MTIVVDVFQWHTDNSMFFMELQLVNLRFHCQHSVTIVTLVPTAGPLRVHAGASDH